MKILAIDPGNIESAYVVLDENLKPIEFGKVKNKQLLDEISTDRLQQRHDFDIDHIAIEMMASMGMSVGQTVFDTCVWIGRFVQAIPNGVEAVFIYRKEEKINLCGNMKAKDSNIIQALKDRFGDKGTIKNPGWFYGFKSDIWQAYAVGITYNDLYLKGGTVDEKADL